MNRRLGCLILCLLPLLVCSCQPSGPQKPHGTWCRFTTTDGLISKEVNAVAEDNLGNVWFATDQGVSMLAPQGNWIHYRAADGLGADKATDVVIDHNGRVWISTEGGGVHRYNDTDWQTWTSANSNLPDDYARRLAADTEGNLWVLSLEGLSVVLQDDTVAYVGNPLPLVGFQSYNSITIDTEGHVWIATALEPSLAEYNPKQQRWNIVGPITEHIELPEGVLPYIWGISADRQENHLWIAATDIIELSEQAWHIHQSRSPPFAAFVDSEGYKWFGLRGRLLVLSPNGQQQWYLRGGSGNSELTDADVVHNISTDPWGNLWFATHNGAIQFTPDK